MRRTRSACGIAALVGLLSWSAATAAQQGVSENATTDLASPIRRALEFIYDNREKTAPTNLMLLDFLQRKFDLEPRLAFRNTYTRQGSAEDKALVAIYGRLIDAEAPSPGEVEEAPAFIRNDLRALYCKKSRLPEDFLDRLERQSERGGYDLTHAALALQWACEQHYEFEDERKVEQLQARLVERLRRLVQKEGCTTDHALEAMAYLHYMGKPVPAAWTETVVKAQQPDGGFSGTSPETDTASDPHSTLLGAWVLLEAEYPEAPSESIMVQATERQRPTATR